VYIACNSQPTAGIGQNFSWRVRAVQKGEVADSWFFINLKERNMQHTKFITVGAALLALGITAAPAMAYEEMSQTASTGQGGGFVGLGAAYGPDYEGGDDYEARIAPFGKYIWGSGRYVSLGGTSGTEKAGRLKANIIATDQSNVWEFGPLLQYRQKRDDVDNRKVDKLKEVDAATEAGAFVGFKSGPWSSSLSYATDVSSSHDGYLWYINSGYRIQVNDRFMMNVGVHLTWADDDYMDEYFGVSGKESAKTGLSKFSASSGFKDYGIGLTGHYKFNQSWGLLGNVGYTRMINDAEDSPIVNKVGDENQYEAVVAVTYSF